MTDLKNSLRELLADCDDVDAGKMPRVSSATLARARQALETERIKQLERKYKYPQPADDRRDWPANGFDNDYD